MGGLLIIALGTAFLLEIQPPILHWAITVLEAQPLTLEGALSDTTAGRGTITGAIGTIAAAIVALAATFQTTLVGWIKKALGAQTLRAKLQALLARTLIYTAGLIVPLAIYALLLLITLWGIRSSICDPVPLEETVVERVCACRVYVFAPASLPVTSSDMLRAVAFLFVVGLISTVLGKFIARTFFGGVIVLAMATLGTILLYWPFSKVLASADFGTWSLMDVVVVTAIVTLVCKYVLFVLFPAEMMVPVSPLRRLYVPLFEAVTELKRLTLVMFAWATLLALSAIATRSHDIDGTAQVVLWCFAASSALFWLLGSPFTGNDNGLHRLYRDRLSAAFRLSQPGNALLLLSKLSGNSPYLLVNATLNASVIDDQEDENPKSDPDAIGKPDPAKRGRNADFFLFSRLFTGSSSTGYATTAEMENVEPRLDLATAVAISGAAVSSSMGRIKIGLLGPTLALLNLKLGFWLTNPKLFDPVYAFGKDRLKAWSDRLRLYLFAEVRGQLRVNSAKVYVTDGGHIDNLGLYQLLKRRCKYIVVIDGEADPGMTFSAFNDLQRFARIDEGVRVILNWMPIRDAALARMADRTKRPAEDEAANDQHFAVGEILYEAKNGAIDKGLLVYVKASMTGDEPDYVLDYERRYPLFPHESTGDQFFSEEQMEAYRALGYHCVTRALTSGGKTSGPLRYGGTGEDAVSAMIRDLKATATTV